MTAKSAVPTRVSFAPEPAHALQPESGTKATFSDCLEPETALLELTAHAPRKRLVCPTQNAGRTYPFASAMMDTTHTTLSASVAAQRPLELVDSLSLECSLPITFLETKKEQLPFNQYFYHAMLPLC